MLFTNVINSTVFRFFFLSLTFSNSRIIHEDKTKAITTVKKASRSDLDYHKIPINW